MGQRFIISDTYVWFYRSEEGAQSLVDFRTHSIRQEGEVVHVPDYGWLVRYDTRLWDTHGPIPEKLVQNSFLKDYLS